MIWSRRTADKGRAKHFIISNLLLVKTVKSKVTAFKGKKMMIVLGKISQFGSSEHSLLPPPPLFCVLPEGSILLLL